MMVIGVPDAVTEVLLSPPTVRFVALSVSTSSAKSENPERLTVVVDCWLLPFVGDQ